MSTSSLAIDLSGMTTAGKTFKCSNKLDLLTRFSLGSSLGPEKTALTCSGFDIHSWKLLAVFRSLLNGFSCSLSFTNLASLSKTIAPSAVNFCFHVTALVLDFKAMGTL